MLYVEGLTNPPSLVLVAAQVSIRPSPFTTTGWESSVCGSFFDRIHVTALLYPTTQADSWMRLGKVNLGPSARRRLSFMLNLTLAHRIVPDLLKIEALQLKQRHCCVDRRQGYPVHLTQCCWSKNSGVSNLIPLLFNFVPLSATDPIPYWPLIPAVRTSQYLQWSHSHMGWTALAKHKRSQQPSGHETKLLTFKRQGQVGLWYIHPWRR